MEAFIELSQQMLMCVLNHCFMNSGALQTSKSNTNHIPLIVGASVGGAAVIAALLALTICIARRKRSPKQTEDRSQSYGKHCSSSNSV
jgi:hypothetical protein